jgi:P-type E1-E2 ATPase
MRSSRLERLLPDEVTVRRGGRDVIVPLDQVSVGELAVVRAGERIAVDGRVVFGDAAVDEAAISGESLPVGKTVGGGGRRSGSRLRHSPRPAAA